MAKWTVIAEWGGGTLAMTFANIDAETAEEAIAVAQRNGAMPADSLERVTKISAFKAGGSDANDDEDRAR